MKINISVKSSEQVINMTLSAADGDHHAINLSISQAINTAVSLVSSAGQIVETLSVTVEK